MIQIREVESSDDYKIWADFRNSLRPRSLFTKEEAERWDATIPEGTVFQRIIAESEIVYGCGFLESPPRYNPRQGLAQMGIFSHKFEGIEKMARHLEDFAKSRGVFAIRVLIQQSTPEHLGLEKIRYVEVDSRYESRLNLSEFDDTGLGESLQSVLGAGYEIVTVGEAIKIPGMLEKIFEVDKEATHDIPSREPITPLSFEVWKRETFNPMYYLEDCWAIALLDGEPVGSSALYLESEKHVAGTTMTGVLKQHRKKGLASAMKLFTARQAKARGFTEIRTSNHTGNRSMLSVNEAMGFRKEPTWIELGKDL